MTNRLASPDTPADVALRELLDKTDLPGFIIAAGAGSGKTTSLVKALAHLVSAHGDELRARTQRVACITYTEVAAREIHSDVDNNPLIMVSTIHSFLWELAKPFQSDIKKWVKQRIAFKVDALVEKQAAYGARVQQATKDKDTSSLLSLRTQLEVIDTIDHFTYQMASDYGNGVLGHEDILNLAPDLIEQKPLLTRIAARQFPYILVDESQDTFTSVVRCLKKIQADNKGRICLGFFGDPMQQIYQRSTGQIELEPGWLTVEKPENFRSSVKVLEVVNQVRSNGDGLIQVAGGSPSNQLEGETFFFVLPADEARSDHLEHVRAWLDQHSSAGPWTLQDPEVGAKILMIVHRMAAKRLGFGDLFAAFNDGGASASLKESFEDGSAWPLRPFLDVIMPISRATDENDPSVIAILRQKSALFRAGLSPAQIRENLSRARKAVTELRTVVAAGGPGSVATALKLAHATELIEDDPRLSEYFGGSSGADFAVLGSSTLSTLDAFTACDIAELEGYVEYVNERSPYSTQHGTKGSEFRKVIVVLDDDEGKYNLYSYDKLLGLKDLSETDLKNQQSGIDSAIERTRRLLYVCVSRAVESLAVVLFAADVESAVASFESSGMPPLGSIKRLADLG